MPLTRGGAIDRPSSGNSKFGGPGRSPCERAARHGEEVPGIRMISGVRPMKNGDAEAPPFHGSSLMSVRTRAGTIYAEAVAARRLLMS
jgi:hypothetical protein